MLGLHLSKDCFYFVTGRQIGGEFIHFLIPTLKLEFNFQLGLFSRSIQSDSDCVAVVPCIWNDNNHALLDVPQTSDISNRIQSG